MRRFHDWLLSKTPDFWRTYYGQPELIKLFAFAHAIEASKSAGFKYLQAYDLIGLLEHTPGTIKVWEPLIATDRVSVLNDFWLYRYTMPPGWLTIELIYDKYVDPDIVLQGGIDFDVVDGYLYTREPLPNVQLYISKGTRTSTRISDNFGKVFDYARYDSRQYRDNFGPLLALMFKGPTIPAVISGMHIVYKQPVSKYDTENIIEIRGNKITTDKYSYKVPSGQVIVTPGQYLPQHTPFTRTIDFHSYQHAIDFNTGIISPTTRNEWWIDKPPGLFQKYSDTVLTEDLKNKLMDEYLKYFVAYVSVRQDASSSERYEVVDDIKRLLYDSLPIRTDIIFSQAMSLYYDAIDDTTDWSGLAFGTADMWCGLNNNIVIGKNMLVEPFTPSYVYGESAMYKNPNDTRLLTAQEYVKPIIYADTDYNKVFNRGSGEYFGLKTNGEIYKYSDVSTYKDKVLWTTSSHRYLLLEYENKQQNAWSVSDSIPPYMDPNYDYMYYRSYTDPALVPYVLHVEIKKDSLDSNVLVDSAKFRNFDLELPTTLDMPSVSTSYSWSFKAQHAYNEVDLFGWDKLNEHLGLSNKKITCALNHSSSLTMPSTKRINIGHHRVKITYTSVFTGPGLVLQYRIDDGEWTTMTNPLQVPAASDIAVQRYLQFQFLFVAGVDYTPSLSQLVTNITIV